MIDIKHRFQFAVSPWFEAMFALQVLSDEDSRIHAGWKRAAWQRLTPAFLRRLQSTGGSPFLWPVVADTLLKEDLSRPFEEMISLFTAIETRTLQTTVLTGIFHETGPVNRLLSGQADLAQTIARVSKSKREWLTFIGLYPLKQKSTLFNGLEMLLRSPREFQRNIARILEFFWDKEFKQTWQSLYPKLEQSKEEKERLFESCSLKEFARMALLRIEVDEAKAQLKAVRGGYQLPLKHLSKAVVLPSAFNDKRHWTVVERGARSVAAFFPYFDPSISLSLSFSSPVSDQQPEIDPALIFKALGDTTRYAITSLLAREPVTAADLAKTLQISRPTVSHHLHVMREAGLLEEKVQGNTVVLSLRREIFENLSEIVTRKLFHPAEEIELKKTRNK